MAGATGCCWFFISRSIREPQSWLLGGGGMLAAGVGERLDGGEEELEVKITSAEELQVRSEPQLLLGTRLCSSASFVARNCP